RNWQVAELVETAQQRVAFRRTVNELDNGFVEVAPEPAKRLVAFFLWRQLVGRHIVELARVGLAASDAAIEEHVVRLLGEERLGPNGDRNRRRATVDFLRLPLERMKEIFVGAIFLGGEVVPDETLYRLIERAHRLFTRRIRHDRTENLEAVHEVAL